MAMWRLLLGWTWYWCGNFFKVSVMGAVKWSGVV